MEHLIDINTCGTAMPVAAMGWMENNEPQHKEHWAGVHYKKTRSTLALNAEDLASLGHEQTIDTFGHLMRMCQILKREEIVIECLEMLPLKNGGCPVRDYLNSVQRDIIRASKKNNTGPARVALEKRGEHYDIRIYPNFH